jgi:Protein of unknown function (DUF1688)
MAEADGGTVEAEARALAEYDFLQTTAAIRARCNTVFEAARRGTLGHFRLNEARLSAVADRVTQVTLESYPDVTAIPYHGRYRHFDAGGVERLARFQRSLADFDVDDRLRASTELVIVSVLLDAGAGMAWRYREPDGSAYSRSEGLAVASYHLFMSGALASDHSSSADAAGLLAFDAAHLASAFQVTDTNPLTGVAGRAGLLQKLGEVVQTTPEYFDSARPRLGDLGVMLKRSAKNGRLPATAVLDAVLRALGPIWPGREKLARKPLGDVWKHARFGLVPFHKLSQWLSYSLLEPLEAAGIVIDDLDELTGLPEYRNGGLFLDTGVLELVEPHQRDIAHAISSELVIEWRALTVVLLDHLADAMRQKLGLTREQLPLAKILEGGSWRAGRVIAAELREDGGPPLRIESDGTVF